jgi:SnoaL-like protein
MEREVLKAVRKLFEAAEPTAGLGPFLALAHPEIEIRPMVTWPGMDPANLRGPVGVQAYFDELQGAFGRIRYELQELTEHGEALVAEVLVKVEGRGSGASATLPSFQVIRVENGLVRSLEGYATRDEAERAVQSPPA